MNRWVMKWLVITAAGLAVSGCQFLDTTSAPPGERVEVTDIGSAAEPAPDDALPPGRVARQVTFPEAEYAALEKQGSASISGRLTLRTQAGSVVGRNSPVSVAPVTTYSAEAAEKALAGQAVTPADPRAQAYTRQTTTDHDGRFTVNGLPAGDYYVSGAVRPPSGQPRIVIHQVRVSNGQSVSVDLSR